MGTETIKEAVKFPNIWETAVDAGDFIKMDLHPRQTIIYPWLRESSLVMIYADRGTGKTWFGISLALSIVTGVSIGKWNIENPVGVLYVDGEMAADEMQDRMRKISFGLPPQLAPLKFLSSDLLHQKNYLSVNINNSLWRKRIYDALAEQKEIKVLILDNLSCLTPGIDENDKEAWDAINQWLISLRFLGVAVIFLHHSGKSGKQRGTSGREDALDIVINLSAPPGYLPKDGANFIVSFEKARGVCGDSLSPFTFCISENTDSHLIWITDVYTSSSKKEIVISLLGNGTEPSQIITLVKCSKQNVSKHKTWAIKNGYLSSDSESGVCTFTEKGREKYAVDLINI